MNLRKDAQSFEFKEYILCNLC